MNIIEKLKGMSVEITPEIEKALAGDYLSELEVEKKLSKLQKENESLKQRAEAAEETLKGFDGKDFDTITKERDEWKKKAEDAEKDYTAKMAEHEKQELLKEAFADVEFTSTAAKNAIMAQIAESVSVKNGKLIGFNDLLEDARKNDASAFVDKQQQSLEEGKAKFTTPIKGSKQAATTKEDIMKIENRAERQRAIAQNLELFQQK